MATKWFIQNMDGWYFVGEFPDDYAVVDVHAAIINERTHKKRLERGLIDFYSEESLREEINKIQAALKFSSN